MSDKNSQDELLNNEISKQEVFNVLEIYNAFNSPIKGIPNTYNYYNSQMENQNLIDLNNNPKIPTNESLRQAIANYKTSADSLQDYSEFMKVWDNIYKRTLEIKANLLAINIDRYCENIKDNSEYSSQLYKEDLRRVIKFFNNFKAEQEFADVVKNVLINGAYFCWLRDSYGSFDEEILSLDDEDNLSVKKSQRFALQMMPQNYCRIAGEFTEGYLWDFDLNYFYNSNVNPMNYDPSLIKEFNNKKETNKLKSFINNKIELDKTNGFSSDGYVRTKVNDGAWCFKYDTSNFNIVPPFASLMKDVFENDFISKLQKDKDIISANAIIVGEMKTKKDPNGNEQSFIIDPTQVGTIMQLARKGINKNIKQLALPLENTRLYQFADNNSNMYKNHLKTSAGLSIGASSLVYTDEKLSQEEMQLAINSDYEEIAKALYPQFENFLNFFVNKKTKKYKFRFSVTGSTLPFLRKQDVENHLKLSDKGIQVPISRWGSLLGYKVSEFDMMVNEARYGDMQDKLFLLLNSNTTKDGSEESGAPKKDNSDLSEGGAVAREYG